MVHADELQTPKTNVSTEGGPNAEARISKKKFFGIVQKCWHGRNPYA
jgi:hypothetical protein